MSFIISLLGCNSSKDYLKNHEVFLYSSEIVQEKKYKISVKQANDIYTKFLYDKKEIKDLNYNKSFFPTLIIDDHYVYSFHNLIEKKVAVFGVWINANTGEITYGNEKIWIYEEDILNKKE